MKQFFMPFMLRPKAKDESGPRYGDTYARAVAVAIDVMIVFFLLEWLFTRINAHLLASVDQQQLSELAAGASFSQIFSALRDSGFFTYWISNAVLQFLIIGVFFVSCQLAYHTTPGKWLLGLKLVRRNDHTAYPSAAQYAVRYLAYFLSCAPLMAGVFWASFNKERRTWHDMIAGTVVLDTRPRGWYWAQMKRLYARLRGKSVAPEQPVGEPAASEGDKDRSKPIE